MVVGAGALYFVVQGLVPVLMTAGGLPVAALLDAAGGGAVGLLQSAVIAGLVLAALDVMVVMRRNRKKTRMTKKEVQDENKNSEGDPLIKSQRRSRQLAMSRNRMIAAVGGADVVLVNPTHVAVALKYEPGKSAPRVVAKGAGTIAARIREEAETDAGADGARRAAGPGPARGLRDRAGDPGGALQRRRPGAGLRDEPQGPRRRSQYSRRRPHDGGAGDDRRRCRRPCFNPAGPTRPVRTVFLPSPGGD